MSDKGHSVNPDPTPFISAIVSSKAIAREARRPGLLDDAQARLALAMVDDRNETVDTYNEAVAQAIHSRLVDDLQLLRDWLHSAARWVE